MKHRPPLTLKELRDIGAGHKRNPDVIALLWEIRRLQDLIRQADEDRKAIESVWRDAGMGHLTALHHLRLLLREEVRDLPSAGNANEDQVGQEPESR